MQTTIAKHLEKMRFLLQFFTDHSSATRKEFFKAWYDSYLSDNGENIFGDDLFDTLREELYALFHIDIDVVSEQKRGPGVRYGIVNRPFTRENAIFQWTIGFLAIPDMVKLCMSIKDYVLLDDFPSTYMNMRIFAEAIKENRHVAFSYKKYSRKQSLPRKYNVRPHFLVSYRNRLYLIAKVGDGDFLRFGLDRMTEIHKTDKPFERDSEESASDFLRDCFSFISKEKGMNCKEVVIRTYDNECCYLEDVPLHHSQRKVRETEEYVDYKVRLFPTMDFHAAIQERGDRMEIMSPQEERATAISRLFASLKRYFPSFDVDVFMRTFAEKSKA